MSPWQGSILSGLTRFPTAGNTEYCSRAVTRGLEILASAVFAPFMSMFIYSIRMRLLTPGEDGYTSPENRGFKTCQLISRHWIISYSVPQSNEPRVEEVRGEGIIGFYPKLCE